MNNRERRLRDRYQQRQRDRIQPPEEEVQLATARDGLTWSAYNEASDIDYTAWARLGMINGPGIREWLRVKDDWTDLAAFENKCRAYGFPDSHPYGKLEHKRDITMTFDNYSL